MKVGRYEADLDLQFSLVLTEVSLYQLRQQFIKHAKVVQLITATTDPENEYCLVLRTSIV